MFKFKLILFFLGYGNFPYKNLCGSTNSVLARHYFYSHSLKNIKRVLNYFDNFFLFFKDYLHKNIFI